MTKSRDWNRRRTIKLLTLSGSPTVTSSTDMLLARIASGVAKSLMPEISCDIEVVRLAEHQCIPCQACGKAPTPAWCFYDDLDPLYKLVVECDALVFGSPIFFDNVSAQAKLFIDRCNCFRPYDFDGKEPGKDFIKLLNKPKRPGAMVFVGGDPWIEGARRTVVGFFRWIEVESLGIVQFQPADSHSAGQVAQNSAKLAEAESLGGLIGTRLKERA